MDEAKNLTESGSPLMAAPIPTLLDSTIMESIKWPYLIVAIGHILYSFGYIAVIYLRQKMPIHDDQSAVVKQPQKQAPARSLRSDLVPIVSIIFLYAAGCGSERLFQSMQVRDHLLITLCNQGQNGEPLNYVIVHLVRKMVTLLLRRDGGPGGPGGGGHSGAKP